MCVCVCGYAETRTGEVTLEPIAQCVCVCVCVCVVTGEVALVCVCVCVCVCVVTGVVTPVAWA